VSTSGDRCVLRWRHAAAPRQRRSRRRLHRQVPHRGPGDHLLARAHVLRPGTTLTVAAVDISVARNGKETLCAAAFVTMRNITNKARSTADAA